MTEPSPDGPWAAEQAFRARLAADLKAAMKARDAPALTAVRTLIGALDNAGAVAWDGRDAPVFGRSGDVPRRDLSQADIARIIAREAAEREAAVIDYEAGGQPAAADRLRAELRVIARYADAGAGE